MKTPPKTKLLKALRRSILSRREFLKATLLFGAAAVPLTEVGRSVLKFQRSVGPSQAFETREPVAILGGGVAGLTAAYYLTKAGHPCEIFEASNRAGGRIFTKYGFNTDGMSCEMGGELIDSGHESLMELVREMGLETVDFSEDDAKLEAFLFHIGGQRYYEKDLIDGIGDFAAVLAADIQSLFVDPKNPTIDYRTNTEAARRLDQMSLADYLERHRGLVDPWILKAFEIGYVSEFGLDASEQSCLNLLMMVVPDPGDDFSIFGPSDECRRIKGGNSKLIEALTASLKDRIPIHYGHRLARVVDMSGGKLELTFESSGSSKTAEASRALCTLPFSTLRDVEGVEELDLSAAKKKCIQELGYGTNSKHILGFSDRPWHRKTSMHRASTGYSFTDLSAQNFWDSSRGQIGKSGILTGFLSGSHGKMGIPTREQMLRDLEKIFPGTTRFYDRNHAAIEWEKMPFARGSYACPKVGQYTSIMGSQKEAELGGRLLFAGEHVSVASQGFMNGAIETAVSAVQDFLKS